jgi:hypothetical protein
MNGIPVETAHTGASAPAEAPQPAKSRVSAHTGRTLRRPRPSRATRPTGEEGQHRRGVGQVAQEGSRRPPGQQDCQGSRPAQPLRRRLAEGTHESHRLADPFGPRVPVRRLGKKMGLAVTSTKAEGEERRYSVKG